MIGPISQQMFSVNAAVAEQTGFNPLQHDGSDFQQNLDQFKNDKQSVRVNISEDSQALLTQVEGEMLPATQLQNNTPDYSKLQNKKGKPPKGKDDAKRSEAKTEKDQALSEDEEQMVEELKERDAEVRTHEQQHAAAAGPYLRGGPYYEYQTGPDGQMYAVGGHVDLDVSEEETPEATIRKAQTVRQSASATGNPSSADQSVAQAAAAMEMQARAELMEEDGDNETGEDKEDNNPFSSKSDKLQNAYSPYEDLQQTGVILNVMG